MSTGVVRECFPRHMNFEFTGWDYRLSKHKEFINYYPATITFRACEKYSRCMRILNLRVGIIDFPNIRNLLITTPKPLLSEPVKRIHNACEF